MKRSSSSMELRSYKRQNCPNGNSNMQPVESESEINIPVESECEFNMVDDLLTEIIFKFVPMCQWSSCLEYVSKKFRRCVFKAYSRIKVVNLKTLFSLKLSSNNPEMKNLLIVSKQVVMTARLNNILDKLFLVCPNLTSSAGFDYVTPVMNSKSTWNILKKFDRLESISFDSGNYLIVATGIKFQYFRDFVVGHKSLKNLNIFDSSFSDSGPLDVSSLSSVAHKTAKNIVLENLSEKLTALTIGSFQRYFKNAAYAEQEMILCVNLESLSVYIRDMVDYKILFNVLPRLCKLTELHVFSGWTGLLDASVFGEEFCDQLKMIKCQLQFVEISGLELSNELQRFLLTKCLNLQRLKVDNTSSLSINDLKKFSSLPGKLKVLTFSDDRGKILPLLLPKLAQLSNFTDITVRGDSLSKWEDICRLPHLRNLRLYGGYIDDSLLEKWNKENDKMFENLVTLKLPYCQGISDVGGCLFAKKAKNLQLLDLSASQIGDKTISILADVAKKLTRATFVHCKRLRDEKAFFDFMKKAVCLKKLEIDRFLAKKVVVHKDFMPFVEIVELNW